MARKNMRSFSADSALQTVPLRIGWFSPREGLTQDQFPYVLLLVFIAKQTLGANNTQQSN